MRYLLDTNVFVDLGRSGQDAMRARLYSAIEGQMAVSEVTVSELEYGAAKASGVSRSLQALVDVVDFIDLLPFDVYSAPIYGKIRANLEREGRIIGGNDLMIAATALSTNRILVTRDTDEFSRVPGLQIEDWTK